MGVHASNHPTLMRAVQQALDKENAGKPQRPKVTWLARSPMLKIKPIMSKDPVQFKQMVETIQAMNPGLTLYLFEIEGT